MEIFLYCLFAVLLTVGLMPHQTKFENMCEMDEDEIKNYRAHCNGERAKHPTNGCYTSLKIEMVKTNWLENNILRKGKEKQQCVYCGRTYKGKDTPE